ncbi:hypothetical protein EV126DRAFT_372262, partial [Verticillium dahliae]
QPRPSPLSPSSPSHPRPSSPPHHAIVALLTSLLGPARPSSPLDDNLFTESELLAASASSIASERAAAIASSHTTGYHPLRSPLPLAQDSSVGD